jgi:hypothetical protein
MTSQSSSAIRGWRALAPSLLLLVSVVFAGCDTPTGPNLAALSCKCHDQGSGGDIILPARICTDLSKPDKVKDDAQAQCDAKETKCFPTCVKIENCGVFEAPAAIGMCPNNASPLAGGDFGQATAVATSAEIQVTGGDVEDFTTALDELRIAATQSGGMLELADIAGYVAAVDFETSGVFGIGGGSHTLSDVHLLLTRPFSIPIVNGAFEIPEDVANFVVSARLDGDLAPLAATSKFLEGIYDEEQGIFTIFGEIDPAGADVHLAVEISLVFENRPPRARAGADQTVECTSPTMTAVVGLSGADSFDLDGAADIARYLWTVDFGTPEAETALGANVSFPFLLGSNVVTLAVADQRGSFGVDHATVTVQDTTGPALAVTVPRAIEVPHSARLALAYAVTDACTGVAQQTATLDGATSSGGHGLASGETIDVLLELAPGPHTFTLGAKDALANASTTTVQFTVVVTPQSLIDAIERFADDGRVKDPGTSSSLVQKARLAGIAYDAGSCDRAAQHYETFQKLVRTHTPKKIDPAAAAILLGDAQYLVTHCS